MSEDYNSSNNKQLNKNEIIKILSKLKFIKNYQSNDEGDDSSGYRPELIKMSRVINELEKNFYHVLVHTGQNSDYELNQIFFDDLEIKKPDYFLDTQSENPIKTISNVFEKVDEVIKKKSLKQYYFMETPILVWEQFLLKRNKVPIFLHGAGNRCFDQRVPEKLIEN